MQLALEYSGLASEILSLIVLRECYVNIEVLADILTSNLLLEAGDKGTGTKLQRELLTLAALKSYAVEEALEVDNSGIADLSCSDRKSTRLNSSHTDSSRMPSSA